MFFMGHSVVETFVLCSRLCDDVIHTTCRILFISRDGSTKFTAKLVTQLGDSG